MVSVLFLVNIQLISRFIMDAIFFFIVAVSLAYAVGCWGKTRKIGFGLAFVLSLVNLFVGIIAVACSKKLDKDNK